MSELILCETTAAITVHARYLTKTGPHYGGGADSQTLCGRKPSWDLKGSFKVEHVRCRECLAALNLPKAETEKP